MIINKLLGRKSPKSDIILTENGIELDNLTMANKFNAHFIEVGENFGCKSLKQYGYRKYMDKKSVRSFFFQPLTVHEIQKLINDSQNSKASNDTTPLHIFKLCPDEVFEYLVHLLNLCIDMGCMPQILKTSLIIPIYKAGAKSELANYRPISLLSYIDKVLEKAIHKRLYDYLSKSDFFCENQFGFRENHSTELALLSLTDRVYEAVDNRKHAIIVSLDLRKAFDVIRHDILLDKLENVGVRGFMLKWFSAYFNNREQKLLLIIPFLIH